MAKPTIPRATIDESLARSLRTEYCEVGQNLRFYGDVRFKELTVFVTLTVALAAGGLQFDQASALAAAAGIALAPIFFLLDWRNVAYWWQLMQRANEIESLLGVGEGQYQRAPHRRVFNATNATRAIYVGSLGFWIGFIIA